MKYFWSSRFLCAALCAMALSSCQDRYFEDMKIELYTRNFIKEFGLIDPNQDWNMAQNVDLTVDLGAATPRLVKIYCRQGQTYYLVARLASMTGKFNVPVDVPEGCSEFMVNVDGAVYYGTASNPIDCTGAPASRSSYDHDTDTFTYDPTDPAYSDSHSSDPKVGIEVSDAGWYYFNAQQMAPIIANGIWADYWSYQDEKLKVNDRSTNGGKGLLPENGNPNQNHAQSNSGKNDTVIEDFVYTTEGTNGEFTINPMFYGSNLIHTLGVYFLYDNLQPMRHENGEIIKFPIFTSKQGDDIQVKENSATKMKPISVILYDPISQQQVGKWKKSTYYITLEQNQSYTYTLQYRNMYGEDVTGSYAPTGVNVGGDKVTLNGRNVTIKAPNDVTETDNEHYIEIVSGVTEEADEITDSHQAHSPILIAIHLKVVGHVSPVRSIEYTGGTITLDRNNEKILTSSDFVCKDADNNVLTWADIFDDLQIDNWHSQIFEMRKDNNAKTIIVKGVGCEYDNSTSSYKWADSGAIYVGESWNNKQAGATVYVQINHSEINSISASSSVSVAAGDTKTITVNCEKNDVVKSWAEVKDEIQIQNNSNGLFSVEKSNDGILITPNSNGNTGNGSFTLYVNKNNNGQIIDPQVNVSVTVINNVPGEISASPGSITLLNNGSSQDITVTCKRSDSSSLDWDTAWSNIRVDNGDTDLCSVTKTSTGIRITANNGGKTGSTNVTLRATSGSASANIQVKVDSATGIASMTASETSLSLYNSAEQEVILTCLNSNDDDIAWSDAKDQINIENPNTNLVTVEKTNTGLKFTASSSQTGNCNVRLYTNNNVQTIVQVTVTADPGANKIKDITPNPSTVTVNVGASQTVSLTCTRTDNSTIDWSTAKDQISISSDNSGVATASKENDGIKITGVAEGTTTIRFSVDGSEKATIAVTVNAAPAASTTVSSFDYSPSPVTVNVNSGVNVTLTPKDADNNSINWSDLSSANVSISTATNPSNCFSASLNGSNIWVWGESTGSGEILVKVDNVVKTRIPVTVENPNLDRSVTHLSVSPSSIHAHVGDDDVVITLSCSDDNGPVTITDEIFSKIYTAGNIWCGSLSKDNANKTIKFHINDPSYGSTLTGFIYFDADGSVSKTNDDVVAMVEVKVDNASSGKPAAHKPAAHKLAASRAQGDNSEYDALRYDTDGALYHDKNTVWNDINKEYANIIGSVDSYPINEPLLVRARQYKVKLTLNGEPYTGKFGMYIDYEWDSNEPEDATIISEARPRSGTHYSQSDLNELKYEINGVEKTFHYSYAANFKHPMSPRFYLSFEDWQVTVPAKDDPDVNGVKYNLNSDSNKDNYEGWDWASSSGDYSSDRDLNDLIFRPQGLKAIPTSNLRNTSEEGFSWIWALEDLGSFDDFDFNDVVIKINTLTTNYVETDPNTHQPIESTREIKKMLTLTPMCAGGILPIHVHLKMGPNDYVLAPGSYSSFADLPTTETEQNEYHKWFGENIPHTRMLNTGYSAPIPVTDAMKVKVALSSDFTLEKQTIDYKTHGMDTYFYVTVFDDRTNVDETQVIDRDYEVPRPEAGKATQSFLIYCGRDDADHTPSPKSWNWPIERVSIKVAYPRFGDWITQSSGNEDWMLHPTTAEGKIFYPSW